MKILACDNFQTGGGVGSSVHIHEVISRLSHMGHDITLLNGDHVGNKTTNESTSEDSLWRRIEKKLVRWRVFRPFRGELSLIGILRHEFYVFLSVMIILLRKRGSVDVIYRRHCLFNSEYFLARLFRIPLVKEVNGLIADEFKLMNLGDKFFLWLIDRIERFNMPNADRIIVVTPKLKDVLYSEYRIKPDTITIIQNGANIELFKPMNITQVKNELNLRQDCSYISFIGTLVQWQGIEHFIRSTPALLDDCPQIYLLIVGDGQIKQQLMDLAERVGIQDKTIFVGTVPYDKVPLYVNASDVCVAPKTGLRSGYSPLKLCEYMACGKPVVGSRASGLEILEESNSGILVEPENPAEIATAITKLIKDEKLRKWMGENGRNYVVENQSWESVAGRVAEVLGSAMQPSNITRK
jgi:glycosyltransferase involved in cell wall biosynthesis